jgi:hypothetical protein
LASSGVQNRVRDEKPLGSLEVFEVLVVEIRRRVGVQMRCDVAVAVQGTQTLELGKVPALQN